MGGGTLNAFYYACARVRGKKKWLALASAPSGRLVSELECVVVSMGRVRRRDPAVSEFETPLGTHET